MWWRVTSPCDSHGGASNGRARTSVTTPIVWDIDGLGEDEDGEVLQGGNLSLP